MLGLIGLIIANQSSLQRIITMQERHLCWPSSGPPVFSFYSIIVTDCRCSISVPWRNDARLRK